MTTAQQSIKYWQKMRETLLPLFISWWGAVEDVHEMQWVKHTLNDAKYLKHRLTERYLWIVLSGQLHVIFDHGIFTTSWKFSGFTSFEICTFSAWDTSLFFITGWREIQGISIEFALQFSAASWKFKGERHESRRAHWACLPSLFPSKKEKYKEHWQFTLLDWVRRWYIVAVPLLG